MSRTFVAETTVEKYMKQAAAHRPQPDEPMIRGVMVATFDNLTMNVAYHSYSVGGITGEKLDMTNWFVVRGIQRLEE